MRRIVLPLLAVCLVQAALAQQPRLLVAVKGEHALAIVDPSTHAIVAKVDESGVTGHEVAVSPDGRYAFVPIYGNSGVGKPGTDGSKLVKIDLATHKIVATLDFGHGVRPHCPVIGPKDGLLYVTTELDKVITLVDPKTLKIVGSIPTGAAESHMLALSHDGARGYTSNVGPGSVSVLDTKTRALVKVIPVADNIQRIAVTRDGRWVFTADQTRPQLAVIDTTTNAVSKWIPLDGLGYGGAMTLEGSQFLMTVPSKGEIEVIDLKTMQVARRIATTPDPEEVIVAPDGAHAWVSSPASGQVAEIDLAAGKMRHTLATGKDSDGLAWTR
jgi:DNA-binding beta-propeller fold protein YncE